MKGMTWHKQKVQAKANLQPGILVDIAPLLGTFVKLSTASPKSPIKT
jgi:hypothetical protein